MAAAVELSSGQITGVVLGSVGCALLLVLLACLVCCLRTSRRRQTGDLTWAKAADLETAAARETQHQPLPGSASPDDQPAAQRRAGASFGNGFEVDFSATTFNETEGDAAASPTSASDVKMHRARSAGGGFAHFLGTKGLVRAGKDVKDKHLEVSRSARVEPSAEVQMAETYEPAATNMGPPLSKSSMLMRWLNGADDGPAEAVAAQLAAGDTAAGGTGTKGSSGRSGRANTVGGGGGGLGAFSDRLPLLSLAAQQTGIVWSKMPVSVTSSPAVSLVESSSMHMLRGTWKRSDLDDTAASSVLHHMPSPGAGRQGGDERYPPSLARASVEALSQRNSNRRNRPGIVFDHVSTTPSSSRATTAGGAPSRHPTFGGAVPPTIADAFDAAAFEPAAERDPSAAPAAAAAARPGAAKVAPSPQQAHVPGFGADDAFLARLPDEHVLAQALQRHHQSSPERGEVAGSATWLHQAPPTKLTALREAEEEAEDEVAPAPLPLQPMAPPLLQLEPCLEPSLLDLCAGDDTASPQLPVSVGSSWTHFGDPDSWQGKGRAAAGAALNAACLSPEESTPQSAASRLTMQASPLSPFLQVATGSGDGSGGSGSGGDCQEASTSESGAAPRVGGSMNDMAGEVLHCALRTNSAVATTAPVPSRGAADPTAGAPSTAAGTTTHRVPVHRRVMVPAMARGFSQSGSLRSQASVSPSLGVHYPEWGSVTAASEVAPPAATSTTAAVECAATDEPCLPMARCKSLLGDDQALAALVQQASRNSGGGAESGPGGRRGRSSAAGGLPASPT